METAHLSFLAFQVRACEPVKRERVVIGKTGLEVYSLGFGGIPIQIILGLRSIARRMGEGFLLRAGPREAIERARRCSECGDCMGRCPYELPIPDLIRENLQ